MAVSNGNGKKNLMTKAELVAEVEELEDMVSKIRRNEVRDPEVFHLLCRRAKALKFLSQPSTLKRLDLIGREEPYT